MYNGGGGFAASISSVLSQVFNVGPSATAISSSQNPAAGGSPVTFTATVSGSGATPAGTVVFNDGTNVLGSGTLDGSGMASLGASALSVSNSPHSMTAFYGGDSNYSGSTSGALLQIIGPAFSTNTITSSQNPAAARSVVTFTSTVTGSIGTPTGTVTLYDGASQLGSGTLNSSGVAVLSTRAL